MNITASDPNVACSGFCDQKFHLACLSKKNEHYTDHILKFLSKISNVKWYCDKCDSLAMTATYKAAITKLIECTDVLNELVQPFRTHLREVDSMTQVRQPLSDLVIAKQTQKQASDNASESDADLNAQQTSQYRRKQQQQQLEHQTDKILEIDVEDNNDKSFHSIESAKSNVTTRRGKRPRNETESNVATENESKRPKSNIQNDQTEPNLDQFITAKSLSSTNNSRSIYISGFQPKTEASDIARHLRSLKLDKRLLDELVITKLVSNGANQRELSFVSFKLQVPIQYYDVLSHPNVWPPSVTVREFVNGRQSSVKPIHSRAEKIQNNRTQQKRKNFIQRRNANAPIQKNKRVQSTKRFINRNTTQQLGQTPEQIICNQLLAMLTKTLHH